MTVARMREEMSNAEWVMWSSYHQRKAQKAQKQKQKQKQQRRGKSRG